MFLEETLLVTQILRLWQEERTAEQKVRSKAQKDEEYEKFQKENTEKFWKNKVKRRNTEQKKTKKDKKKLGHNYTKDNKQINKNSKKLDQPLSREKFVTC